MAPELVRLLLRTPPPPAPGQPEPTAEEIASQTLAQQEVIEEVITEVESAIVVDREYRLKAWRLAGLGLLIVITIAVTLGRLFVGGPPTVAELREQAGVDTWPSLAIGVKDDQFGTAYYDPVEKRWSGFDIDIAYMIAEDLGFRREDVQFYGMESEDRARMQADDPVGGERVPVHMVIASYSITQTREDMAGVTFSQGYLDTEQSVLTLKGHSPVAALKDLAGRKVCSLSTSTSQSALEDFKAIVIRKNRVRECFALLDSRQVEAISTDAAILAGWKHRYPEKYDHFDLGLDATERWGVNVGENLALKELVDLTLYRSWADPKDSRWEEAFDRNFQVEVAANGGTPIAAAHQPRVERPDVRWLPWEDPLG
ncbi:transporter substrate-binding domain-containing protein [Actinoplanes sp. NEAU-H7]|uniref:Transporter substrate-binding domain-containing protein n=2 Tax=Actinoplanes flavus TaxID=2820290 RepID=A0ABS3UV04_9ACTN|nr:transporter substrate-binding domain-containing protein [Actinoplanes flavus]